MARRSIRSRCTEAGINYDTFLAFKSNHPELSTEDIFEYYAEKRGLLQNDSKHTRELKKLRYLCKQNNIPYVNARQYKKNHPSMPISEVVAYYLLRTKSFRQKCKERGINYRAARSYRNNHPELSDDEIIEIYNNNVTESCVDDKTTANLANKIPSNVLKRMAQELNIKVSTITSYAYSHPGITESEIRDYYNNKDIKAKSDPDHSFKAECKKIGVNYSTASNFKYRHPEMSESEIIKHYIEINQAKTFKDMCNECNIPYKTASSYKYSHPELSAEEVINRYLLLKGEFCQFSVKKQGMGKGHMLFEYIENGKLFFQCTCNKCGHEDIYNFEDMREHFLDCVISSTGKA